MSLDSFHAARGGSLSAPRGAALYIGALLGPGLLLLPGLAAAEAGPASILAWLVLLGLSGLFAAVAGASFLAGVVCGAPIVCLIGASYVTDLVGGGTALRCAVAAALLLVVLALASGGLRASTTVQLVLVSLLTAVIVAAVAGAAPAARAANWLPFAPHGWASLGHAAATIAVLGRAAATDVPLAGLLTHAIGGEGRLVAAVVAVVLTLGTTNAYLSGAVTMARKFAQRPASRAGRPGNRSERPLLAVIAAAFIAVAALLSFCGWALALSAAVALTAALCSCRRRGSEHKVDAQGA